MKKISLLVFALFLHAAAWAQYFDSSHPGFILLGKYSPVDGGALTNLQGNGQGLTNLTGLVFTNSSAAGTFLSNGKTQTVNAAGFLTISVILTNTQIVWATNTTSGFCVVMGNTAGVWTNYDNAQLFCNPNDVVLVTNISGSGGAGLVSSYFQAFH